MLMCTGATYRGGGGALELVLGLSDTWSPYWDRHTQLVVSSCGLEPDVDAATVSGATDWPTVLLTVELPASRCHSPPA